MDQNMFHHYTEDAQRLRLDTRGFEGIRIEQSYGGCGYRAATGRAE